MIPGQFRRANEMVEEQLHGIDSEVAKLDKDIEDKEAELATLKTRKADFDKVKTGLLEDKTKLEKNNA
jgi:hypothetical protein